jgi:hypothetical protein
MAFHQYPKGLSHDSHRLSNASISSYVRVESYESFEMLLLQLEELVKKHLIF